MGRIECRFGIKAPVSARTTEAGRLSYSPSVLVKAIGKERLLARCAAGAGALATIAAIHLHWVSFVWAGGLWRDEIAATNIARLPSLGAMWNALPHDHCPILFASVIRIWSGTFGGTDVALRVMGFAIGMFLLGSLWLAGRLMWRGTPVLCLTLFGLNVVVIRYGDSVRAYELGTACIVLTMALVWRFVEQPSIKRAFAAALMATASVQALYQNSVLVLALCVAGCAVFASQREWRKGIYVLAIGLLPAVSLAPYVRPLLRAQDWWVVSKTGLSARIILSNLALLTGHPARWFRFIWLGLLISVLLLAFERAVARPAERQAAKFRKLALFAGVALFTGILGYGLFLATAQLPTQPWYFLVLLGFAAVCCDAVLSGASFWMRVAVLGLALIAGVLAYPAGIRALEFRQTDGDIVATQVSRSVAAGDLIVVNPWYYALTFSRYYHGAAPWTTLAGLNDYRYHRYDLLKLKLEAEHPEQPELDRVATTLRAGHRVWVVGWVPVFRLSDEPPPELPPAPHGPSGWFDDPYTQSWGARLYYLLATRAQSVIPVPVDSKDRINPLENMGLTVASGWRGDEEGKSSSKVAQNGRVERRAGSITR